MKKERVYGNFASTRNATFDYLLPPKADPARVGLVAAGNPNVISEAEGKENYARRRKRGGRVKHVDVISGGRARHRLDRRSRRKFADGGDADAQPAQTPPAAAPSSWLPPRYEAIGRGAGLINQGAEAVGRGVAAGIMAINRETNGAAYRRGGRAR